MPEPIESLRIRLVPGSAELLKLELTDRAGLSRHLRAEVPLDWPPEPVRKAVPFISAVLTSDPTLAGWLSWYGIARRPQGDRLVCSVGFVGRPEQGAVEIGYSVLPDDQRQGYATEMVAALTSWALAQPRVTRVTAEVDATNHPSRKILQRAGFVEVKPGRDPGQLHYTTPPFPRAE